MWIVKSPLIAIVVLGSLAGTAYSQNSSQTGNEQPVHPGTAILDNMGIYAGNPMPVQRSLQAKSTDTQATPVSNPATKQ